MHKTVITYSKKKRGLKRKQVQLHNDGNTLNRVCQFCMSKEDNEVDFGTILEKEDVTVHYFCMLLSSGLCQNTRLSDKKSIFGFLLSDIKKELKRGARLRCSFCHKKGATIGCCVQTCRKAFHLSCGREHGTMHQFFDSFRSYCTSHRLGKKIPQGLSCQLGPSKKICSICLCAVTSLASCDTLIPPCCQKSCFHRQCMQQYALSAGMHYFKCPLCNSVEEFQAEMQMYGVYIPDQDASWERESNAFHELLEQHNNCDVVQCVCPRGRLFGADSGKYELLLCGWCGSYGSHRECQGLVWKGIDLVCWDCAEIIERADKKELEQQRSGPLVDLGKHQIDLPLCRPRTQLRSRTSSLLEQEADQQSQTSSVRRRQNTSYVEHTVQQSESSRKLRRKRQCSRSLQSQSAAGRNPGKRQKQLCGHSTWRSASECHPHMPETECPGSSKDNLSRSSQQEQALKDQEEGWVAVSSVPLDQSFEGQHQAVTSQSSVLKKS